MKAAITALIILGVVGIGWWWYRASDTQQVATTDKTAAVADATATSTGYTYVISSSTPSTAAPAEPAATAVRTAPRVPNTGTENAAVRVTSSPTRFHDSSYGLTIDLPANWAGFRTYVTAGGPSGLPGTEMIHFIAPGETQDAFVVNVWSKQGWNYVRNQENYVHLNTTNIGEGTYLGENFTWIYSVNYYAHPEASVFVNGAVFY